MAIKRKLANFFSKLSYFFHQETQILDSSKEFQNHSFAQEGEDMVLSRLFEGKTNGIFVDVGAHHPFRFSNTYLFYRKGWRGINIDPLPTSKTLFDLHRPEDENLCIGISNSEVELTYYMFNEPALNTFDEQEAHKKNGVNNGQFYIIDKKQIATKKLSTVLNASKIATKNIDFLSIDVEGLDIEVLESNDWEKFRPEVVLVEELSTNISKIMEESVVHKFMQSKSYHLFYKTVNTSFYVRN